ncbi:uncharacterized protein LAJ45_06148 [Morchella importuna]|uniref:uncharacterized protein n=1 Tax=Morchella importuna TaxID=1174673 RepID=UPI001E8CC6A9|nr:uncharacterized protein LAJ45_06148 [Morchella importuna]KAH8149995.1 hypothetical protein LAJ45_06148 [Morchella importuna]
MVSMPETKRREALSDNDNNGLAGIHVKGEKRSFSDQENASPLKGHTDKKTRTTKSSTPEVHSASTIFRKFVTNALNEHAMGNSANYQVLRLKFSADPSEEDAPSSQELQMTITALSQKVSQLNGSCSTLVQDIVECQWVARSSVFVSAYVRFLGNLVSAHSSYMGMVTRMLVGFFGYLPSSLGKLPNHDQVSRAMIRARVHYALQFILDLVPTAIFSTLFPSLVAEFPHKSDKKQAHINYLQNVLKVIEYAPALQNRLLAMITDRVIKVDVEIQVNVEDLEDEEGEELEAELTGNIPQLKDTSTIIEEDDDESDGDVEYDDDEDIDAITNIRETVDKLDSMLYILFEYYSKTLPTKYSHEPKPNAMDTFELMLRTFDNTILPTHRSRFTQFLLFWAAQKSPEFTNHFCVSIIEKALDNTRPQKARQAAAAYIASFVARAKTMSKTDVRVVVRLLCRYLGLFVDERSHECHGPDVSRWGGFYSIVQAVMYIFCFRWRDLKEDEEDEFGIVEEKWTSGLDNLCKAVLSKFNPLKVCAPTVVETFAKIAAHLQFMFCFSVIEQNKRAGFANDGELESYFPFDPYTLKKSKVWIEDYYIEWQPVEGLEDDDEDSSDVDNDADEADELDEDESDVSR